MKRTGHLVERIAGLDNLLLAYTKARRGKQCKREVIDFGEHLDERLQLLRSQILAGRVDVGHYHYFRIYDPKERVICAASFSERVLHHALMNVCHEAFDRRLIDDTFATRRGKGVYAALDKAGRAVSRYAYAGKLDFRKYYDSIRHDVLKCGLRRVFKDARLLSIFSSIIDSYAVSDGCGLPIGNLTSQYFANFYLSALDHRCKEEWGARAYVRYMDDILLADDDADALRSRVRTMQAYAAEHLHLTFKPPLIAKCLNGIPFLGYRLKPHRLLLSGRSKRRFRTKLRAYDRLLASGEWDELTYSLHLQPLLSFVRHAESERFRRACIAPADARREWVEPCEPRWQLEQQREELPLL